MKINIPIWLKILVPITIVGITLTLVFNIDIKYVQTTMPPIDKEVTEAFQRVSGDTAVIRGFTFNWGSKEYLLLETTKESKEMLEAWEKSKESTQK